MLAIMNIGKYSSSGIVPSGSDLFTISASQSLGQAIDFYARKGNIILGLPYMQNTIYRSTDGGATWSTVSMPYYVSHILYSPAKDKFYAVELGDENLPATLHYGMSDDGLTWTWDTLYTNSTDKIHYYGTFVEEINNEIAFDLLKVDGITSTASHIRVFTDNTEELIGSTYSLGFGTDKNVYPYFTYRHNKTKTAVVFESWYINGASGSQLKPVSIGSWGVEAEGKWGTSTDSYSEGNKCFDKFYHTASSASSSNRNYQYQYSETSRENTYTIYSKTVSPANGYNKIYGFFQLGNYFYMAYQRYSNMNTVWYRAGDVNSLIDVLAGDTFNKSDLTGTPVSEFTLDSKHFLLSMADGKVYLCEAT